MTYQEPLSHMAIAIAISESADMGELGLAPEHLHDAMAEIARHLLALGSRLVYGGDLRTNGFTELLFELVARHRRDADFGDIRPAIVNFFAWPTYVAMPKSQLEDLLSSMEGIGELHFLDRSGGEVLIEDFFDALAPVVTDADWSEALTAMRVALTEASDARIVLGGRIEGFKGRMPGIAEEALSALMAKQPLFLLGGFGGCARDIAIELGIFPRHKVDKASWQGIESFQKFHGIELMNGLTAKENGKLAGTVHIDEAVTLILRGLLRLTKSSFVKD